ncbi:transcriptional regulator, partial [Escherichia coli]
MAVLTTGQLQQAMNTKDEQFFKQLGARIAQARKEQQLTQTQLAEQLGIA